MPVDGVQSCTTISEHFRQLFSAHGRYTLALFHASDYLAAAAPDPGDMAGFVSRQREALKQNRHPEVIAEPATRLEPADNAGEHAPARRAHRYLSKRVDQLAYQTATATSTRRPVST